MHSRKLPSGSWQVIAYAGYDPKTKKKFTKSFTGKDLRTLKTRAALWEGEHRMYHAPESMAAVIDRYIESAALSPSTKRGYRSIRKNLPEWLLVTPCHAFSAPLCERFISEMNKSPKTIKNYVSLLQAALRAQDLPAPSVRLPQVPLPRLHIPDADIVRATLETADPEMYIVIMLAATGPLRLGEICALALEDIDRKNSIIHVRRSMVYGADHAYHVKPPKRHAPPGTLTCLRNLSRRSSSRAS